MTDTAQQDLSKTIAPGGGIYAILYPAAYYLNHGIYIGSTDDFQRRWNEEHRPGIVGGSPDLYGLVRRANTTPGHRTFEFDIRVTVPASIERPPRHDGTVPTLKKFREAIEQLFMDELIRFRNESDSHPRCLNDKVAFKGSELALLFVEATLKFKNQRELFDSASIKQLDHLIDLSNQHQTKAKPAPYKGKRKLNLMVTKDWNIWQKLKPKKVVY